MADTLRKILSFLPLNGSLSRATMTSKLLRNWIITKMKLWIYERNNHEKEMSITRSTTCFCEKKLHLTHLNFCRSYKSPMVIRILSPTLSAYVCPTKLATAGKGKKCTSFNVSLLVWQTAYTRTGLYHERPWYVSYCVAIITKKLRSPWLVSVKKGCTSIT